MLGTSMTMITAAELRVQGWGIFRRVLLIDRMNDGAAVIMTGVGFRMSTEPNALLQTQILCPHMYKAPSPAAR